MTTCYSSLFPLLFLLVIIHWIHSASLRSPLHQHVNSSLDRRNSRLAVNSDEYITQEIVLSRRRPHLPPLLKRRKRWTKKENNDEVEIPIDETSLESMNSSESTTISVTNSINLVDLLRTNSTNMELLTTKMDNSSMNLFNTTFSSDLIDNSTTIAEEIISSSMDDSSNRTNSIPFIQNATLETKTNQSELILLSDTSTDKNVTEWNVPLLRQALVTSDAAGITLAPEQTTIEIVEESTADAGKGDIIGTTVSVEQSTENNNSPPSLFTDTISILANDSNQTIAADSAMLTGTTIVNDQISLESIAASDSSNSSIVLSGDATTIVSNEETFISSNDPISTLAEREQDTVIILLEHTTLSYNDTEEINTTIINESDLLIHDKTETFSYNDTSTAVIVNDVSIITFDKLSSNTTIISEVSPNETTIILYDDVNEEDVSSNETTILTRKSTTISVCDRTCQCTKKCPYGFELVNDTCKCKPPCENYQCFGNDTCEVTNKGQPVCRPENGTEHDHPSRCYQPRDEGHHDANIRYYNRWYYHPEQDTCHLFVYRGFGGNENNFPTLHECHLECITCASAPDRGTCLGHTRMWHYDYKKGECAEFEYSGCKGNENKFIRKQECVDTCVTRILNIK